MQHVTHTRTYVLHTPYKSVQDTYVNMQVGISIKLSDVYVLLYYEDKLPNPIGFPYIFLADTIFFLHKALIRLEIISAYSSLSNASCIRNSSLASLHCVFVCAILYLSLLCLRHSSLPIPSSRHVHSSTLYYL